ncbi:type IV toxin-antitoxin system AbiEi family antitoxin domain-containing protein [Gordonia paraffinivorans]|uniref:type IV toxin-antitoxin system AbiEi family antitoxin domain-containing protein n=1 Tax=Gordonia paraffinivorans TaxID=175628 RepID=UPI00058AFF15|nr:type IV toxin-antitoxin system AbiEi family antitoxin domain-containing protein [Gordonia paraffinivorans]
MQTPPGLRRHALGRDGVFTIGDAVEHGLTRSGVHRRLKAGLWTPHSRGVYTLADHPVTARTRARLAVAAAGKNAVLSGLGAAWWHKIVDDPPKRFTVTAPRSRHGTRIEDVRVRYRTLDDAETVTRDHLPITCLPLTVLEAAVEGDSQILDNALLLRRVSIEQLCKAGRRRRNKEDAAEIAALIARVGEGARSEAERRAVAVLRQAGLSGFVCNHPVGGYFVDVAYLDALLAVEIDGMAFHRDADTFQRDRRRRNELIALGWTVLNFTWADLQERPEYVVACVRTALDV